MVAPPGTAMARLLALAAASWPLVALKLSVVVVSSPEE
jgi:hypothetical protein